MGSGEKRSIKSLFAAGLISACGLTLAGSAPTDPPGKVIFDKASAAEHNPEVLGTCLKEIEALILRDPKSAINHYTHGWILSRLNKPEEAVAAYDRAASIDPTFSDAMYNAGVVLAGLGREKEALTHWKAALKADPKHLDAAYNMGQCYYNQKDFKQALEYWNQARNMDPSDFNVMKKVLQAQNALGLEAEAKLTREALLQCWRNSKEPRIKKLTEYVFDQFYVGPLHVYACETFNPTGDLYYVYTFRVADARETVLGTVQLESSAVIREAGTPYILGVAQKGTHSTTGPSFKTLPSYATLKPMVLQLIQKHLMPEPAAH